MPAYTTMPVCGRGGLDAGRWLVRADQSVAAAGSVMTRPVLLRVAFAGLVLVLLVVRHVHRERATSDPSRLDVTNITQLRQELAGLRRPLGCPVLHGHLLLGERSARPHGTDSAGRPEACLTCLCTVKSADADPQPECIITGCPSHMCDQLNPYEFEPDHPCCSVCGEAAEPAPNPTAEPPRHIDAAIPLTSEVYEASFVHEPAAVCAASSSSSGGALSDRPLALLGVTSRPSAADRRAIFRRAYGADLAAARLRLVFVLGREVHLQRAVDQLKDDQEEYDGPEPEEPEKEELEREERQHADLQREVDAEAGRHGDILQTRTAEHYNHLTLKTLTLLDFASRHCREAAFVIKTDDDVLITVRRLAAEVAALAADAHRPSIHGQLCTGCSPSRERLGWPTSRREWPWDWYPLFVTGPGYLVSSAAIKLLLRHAMNTPYHHLEDVFLTGIVAKAAGVERRQWDAQCMNRVRGGNLCAMSHCALSHPDRYEDGGRRMEMFAYAARRLDVDDLCASNVTMVNV